MLNTKLFNIRLYLEGLKRLKVIGLAAAILSVTISALIPIVHWMDVSPVDPVKITVEVIEQNLLCMPLFATVFAAPFFFLVLFSFLHKRKQSDFFHAIPYTRTCVYLSFIASALTFVFLIQIASALTAGLIWAMNPFATFHVGEMISLTLMCMLAAAELSGIMMLALTLTGTPTTTMLMFALFTLFVRFIMFFLGTAIDGQMMIVDTSSLPYLDFTWFLPFSLFMFWMNGHDYLTVDPFRSPANVIYTAIVTVLLFAAAWFFYKKRKSEMAGNTAPNRTAQHIFRILFSLPFALLIPLFILIGESDISLLLVLLVITLLVYYLYELITTKRIKSLGKATLWLPVLVVACGLFTGAFFCVREAIYANTPDDPDDVVSVSMDTSGYYMGWDEYQKSFMEDSVSTDRYLIEQIILAMNQTVECDRTGNYQKYFADYATDPYGEGYYHYDRMWIQLDMKLASGQTVTRRVAFRESSYYAIKNMYVNTIDIDLEQFWSLPKQELLYSIYTEFYDFHGFSDYLEFWEEEDVDEFYKVLSKEYASLSMEEKEWVRTNYAYEIIESEEDSGAYTVSLYGHLENSSTYFGVNLCVTEELMPDTFQYLKDRNGSDDTSKPIGEPSEE